jgi:DNA-binding beta-propeller fold protein YncE
VNDLGRGFTSNGADSSVTVFDMRTLSVLARIRLDASVPDAIVHDPATGRVFVFNAGSANAIALDAGTLQVVGALSLGGRPEAAVADGAGRMYVTLGDRSELVVLDTRRLGILHRWLLAPGERPTALAIDPARHRLFIGCANRRLFVLDGERGQTVALLEIGAGVDGVAFDPGRQLVFCSNADSTLTVFHQDTPSHFSLLENVGTEPGGRTLAYDPATATVYIPTAELEPPPVATRGRPRARRGFLPGTFMLLVIRSQAP